MSEVKILSPDSVNYSRNDIEKAKERSVKAQKELVRESIKARLYGMSYGQFQAEKNVKISDSLMKVRHEAWKKSQEMN